MVAYLDEGGARHLVKKVLDRIQPVGSLYFSTNNESPASLFGGSWERYAQGRVMVSASDTDTDFSAGKTGGNKVHSHWLPMGMEEFVNGVFSVTWRWRNDGGTERRGTAPGKHDLYFPSSRSPHSNGTEQRSYDDSSLQPYVAVYVWRRKA